MLDSEGLHTDRPGAITTWTKARVDPLELIPEDVSIEDIAHALARQCRYNGHVEGFLSVARHSIWVSQRLEDVGCQRSTVLAGLLHDAAETYLGDLPRPLKQADALEAFRHADLLADEAVAAAFGLPFPYPDAVHEADNYVLLNLELDDARHTYFGDYEKDEHDFLSRYRQLIGEAPERPALPTPLLIGLSGHAQTGKDTVAGILTEHLGFERIAFADALREMLYALNPLVPSPSQKSPLPAYEYVRCASIVDAVGWEDAKKNPEIRQLLQRLGTEAGRMILGPGIWVETALRSVEPGGKFVFSDVRFENEAAAIKKRGGEVWRIERLGTEPVNAHASETALDGFVFDRVIKNDGSKVALRRSVLSYWTPA